MLCMVGSSQSMWLYSVLLHHEERPLCQRCANPCTCHAVMCCVVLWCVSGCYSVHIPAGSAACWTPG